MDLYLIIPLALFISGLLLARAICKVPKDSIYIVERLGQYHSSLGAGIHIIVPLIDQVAYRHELREHTMDIPKFEMRVDDGGLVQFSGSVRTKIIDAKKASYEVENINFALEQLALTVIRSDVMPLESKAIDSKKERIKKSVLLQLKGITKQWGVETLELVLDLKSIGPITGEPQEIALDRS